MICFFKKFSFMVVSFLLIFVLNIGAWSAIHDAVKKGNGVKVISLLKSGIPVDFIDEDGLTPLCVAVYNNQSAIVKLLASKGAYLEYENGAEEGSLLHYAVRNGYEKIVKILLRYGANRESKALGNKTPLHTALEYNQKKIFIALLERSADVSAQTKNYQSILHFAVATGDIEYVKILLRWSLYVDVTDYKGLTPFHWSIDKKYKHIASLLLDSGAQIERKAGEDKYTAMHFVVEKGDKELLNFLLEKKASINAESGKDKKTPLHLASLKGHYEIVQELIKKGADYKVRDIYNHTPLYYAFEGNHTEIVKFLLEKGVAIDNDLLEILSQRPKFIKSIFLIKDWVEKNKKFYKALESLTLSQGERLMTSIIVHLLRHSDDKNAVEFLLSNDDVLYKDLYKWAAERIHDFKQSSLKGL